MPSPVCRRLACDRWLRLSLGACGCLVGERLDPAMLQSWPGPGGALLLYPGGPGQPAPQSRPVPAAAAGPTKAPSRLVMLDGTWRKTLKMLRLNAALQDLPRCTWQAARAACGPR